jgi:hypothetical protein
MAARAHWPAFVQPEQNGGDDDAQCHHGGHSMDRDTLAPLPTSTHESAPNAIIVLTALPA